MALSLFVLHVGPFTELSLVDYLYRVLFHLLAFGGLALLVHWGIGVWNDSPSGSDGRKQ